MRVAHGKGYVPMTVVFGNLYAALYIKGLQDSDRSFDHASIRLKDGAEVVGVGFQGRYHMLKCFQNGLFSSSALLFQSMDLEFE